MTHRTNTSVGGKDRQGNGLGDQGKDRPIKRSGLITSLAQAQQVAERITDLHLQPPIDSLYGRAGVVIALCLQLLLEPVQVRDPGEDGGAGGGVSMVLGEVQDQPVAMHLGIQR